MSIDVQNRTHFPEKKYSYCFNASEPVRVKMRNDGQHAFTLRDSCYERPVRKEERERR